MLMFSGDNKLIDLPLELFHSLYPIFLSLSHPFNSSFSGNPSRPTIHPFISPPICPKARFTDCYGCYLYHSPWNCCGLPHTDSGIAALVSLASVSWAQRQTFAEYIPITFFFFFCLPWFLFTARAVSKVANFGIRLFISVPYRGVYV